MRRISTFLVATLALLASACETTRPEPDELCGELAAFAEASFSQGPHTVRLATDWGGVFSKSDGPNEDLMYAKACQHDSYEPGKKLCAYLLDNTSTEFAAFNYRRALSCIGIAVHGTSNISDDQLPPSATSRRVNGKSVRSELLVEFTSGSDTAPPILSITAGRRRAT
jgi:hypothetical protein